MKAALVLLAAGCFSKPGFTPGDSGGGGDGDSDGNTSECPNATPGMTATAATVAWPNLPAAPFIEFADQTQGVPMPQQLSISGTNLLRAEQAQCNVEDPVGVSIYPVFQASGGSDGFTQGLTKLATGPAYNSWRITWAHDLLCNSPGNRATGETRFSMFPDGRIIRTDIITPTTMNVAVADCTRCEASSTFAVTSFTAFSRDALTAIQRTPTPGEGMVPNSADTSVNNSEGGCIVDSAGARLTVLWDQRMPAGPNDTRFRVVSSPGGPVVVFVADLLSAASIAPPSQRSIRTTMVMGAPNVGTCDTLINRAHTVQNFPSISIDGTTRGASPDGTYQLGDRGASVVVGTVGSAIPPGWLVEVRMPGTSVHTSRDASDVIWQHDAATGTFYLFFRTGLANGDTVTLTSGC